MARMDEKPDENPYRAPQQKPQLSEHKQSLKKTPERPSWSNFLIATCLVLLGGAGWFFGLGFGLSGAGPWAEFVFIAGSIIGVVGVLWLLVLVVLIGRL